jgi:hypothetical protein
MSSIRRRKNSLADKKNRLKRIKKELEKELKKNKK